MENNKKLMTIREAAKAYYLPEHALRRWVKEKKVDARYSGRKALICVEALNNFLKKGGDSYE